MDALRDLLVQLILGAYLFAAGGYGWAFLLYRWLREEIRTLAGNHLQDLERRIERLETIYEPPDVP